MDAFVWSDLYLTGEEQVDAEHRGLVDIINKVGHLFDQGTPTGETIERVLDQLAAYAVSHFAHEESLMAEMGCDPRHSELHQRIHRDFAAQIGQLRRTDSQHKDCSFLLHYLTHWLSYHILGTDQVMARQIKLIRQGLTPQAAFDREQNAPKDPATTTLLKAVTGLYGMLASRNQVLTELIQSQREMDLLLSQIVEGDPVPTLVIDAQHRVTHWNRACAAVTGKSTAEMVGSNNQWNAFYPEQRPIMADLIVSGELGGLEQHYSGKFKQSKLIADAYEAEDFFPHFGPGGRWLYFTAAPLRNAEGQIIGAIETLQDVTDRHRAEDDLRNYQTHLEELVEKRTHELARANTQLLQSEKLASIGQLSAGVAHEINNPIGYVYSNISTLEKYLANVFEVLHAYQAAEQALPPNQAERMQEVKEKLDLSFLQEDIPVLMQETKEGISRVKKIVQDLKDFSRMDTELAWQRADIHRGLDSTINVAGNEIRHKAEVIKAFGDIPEIECLPSQLNQVFMNILVNAAQAMPKEGGTITVRTGLGEGLEANHVWIDFIDTAGGIPDAVLPKIFDPFFTTKPVGQGTGLGLSLSYGIIRDHQGRIDVRSKLGVGTTFRIWLPISQTQTNHLSPNGAEPQTP